MVSDNAINKLIHISILRRIITSVSSLLAMPDFDTTLLGLVGISGATYLGFKFPNQQG